MMRSISILLLVLTLWVWACGDSDGGSSKGGDGDGDRADAADPFGNATISDAGPMGVLDAPRDISCGTSPFEANSKAAAVLLVIDKSGSMDDKPEGFSKAKWAALGESLGDALADAKEGVDFGLDLYPFPDGCSTPKGNDVTVPIQDGKAQVNAVLDAIDSTLPSGGTPTAAALARALSYFTEGDGKDLKGDPYVLLATDGGPNCNAELSCDADACTTNLDGDCPSVVPNCCDPPEAAGDRCLDGDDTLAQIQALKKAGITTFVIGIPGSEAYADSLNEFAKAGGAPNPDAPPSYYAVETDGSGVGGLTDVFRSITSGLIMSCALQLAEEPPDIDLLNVEIDGETVPQSGPDGWKLDTDTDPPTLVIKGKTCDRIETEGVQSVDVVYGCPTVVE